MLAFPLQGQNKGCTVVFEVKDTNSNPVELATAVLNQALYGMTGAKGICTINNVPSGRYVYSVSLLGYETVTDSLTVTSSNVRVSVTMRESNLSLEGAVVTAQQDQVGSRSVINQDAIRHIQPKNLGDMLQLVPGNLVSSPNLNNLSQAMIREIDTEGNNNYAVGTSVIVDGAPISNDGNLQVLNANRYGSNADASTQQMGENTTGGKGTDLRLISGQNIESMEVIRGIPSVEYGNLTSGVVIVKTKSGQTPWEAKAQVDPFSKMVFAGKGFTLRDGSAINVSADWAQSWSDTRRHYLGYDRVTASAGYSKQWNRFQLNVKGAFYSNINNRKQDPQMEEMEVLLFKNKNYGGRAAVTGTWQTGASWVDNVDFSLSTQLSHSIDEHKDRIYSPDGLVTNTREEGIHVGRFLRDSYWSEYKIDGRPYRVTAKAKAAK